LMACSTASLIGNFMGSPLNFLHNIKMGFLKLRKFVIQQLLSFKK
jgi:hypothetical protein